MLSATGPSNSGYVERILVYLHNYLYSYFSRYSHPCLLLVFLATNPSDALEVFQRLPVLDTLASVSNSDALLASGFGF